MQKILPAILIIGLIIFSAYSLGFLKFEFFNPMKIIATGEHSKIGIVYLPEIAKPDAQYGLRVLITNKDIVNEGNYGYFWVEAKELNTNLVLYADFYDLNKLKVWVDPLQTSGQDVFLKTPVLSNIPEGVEKLNIEIKAGYFDLQNNRITDAIGYVEVPIAFGKTQFSNLQYPRFITGDKATVKMDIINTGDYESIVFLKENPVIWPIAVERREFALASGETKHLEFEITLTKSYESHQIFVGRIVDSKDIIDDETSININKGIPPPSPPPARGWAFIIQTISEWIKDIFK